MLFFCGLVHENSSTRPNGLRNVNFSMMVFAEFCFHISNEQLVVKSSKTLRILKAVSDAAEKIISSRSLIRPPI